jgi:hypothetical protein
LVYELVRHGARAPLSSEDKTKFTVSEGMLTESGMRQRMLVGFYNRQRYIEEFKLLDETYNPNQIFMLSTDVFRTIQSAYSELMGLYPPGTGKPLTEREHKLLRSNKSLPPIKIRNSNSLLENLNDNPFMSYV